MCYDYINHRIMCLGWNADDKTGTTIKTYTAIDPNTLEVTASVQPIPYAAVEIDYNRELGKFVTICGGSIYILDSDLKTVVKSISRTLPVGWTEQGNLAYNEQVTFLLGAEPNWNNQTNQLLADLFDLKVR